MGEALESLGYYAQIIQYRFNGRHQVELCAADDVREERIPKMLIQPIVENAVFHGLETLTAAAWSPSRSAGMKEPSSHCGGHRWRHGCEDGAVAAPGHAGI